MRIAISLDPDTATTRYQADDEIGSDDLSHDISYAEILEVTRGDYDCRDDPKPRVVKSAEPIATVSWADARPMSEKLKDASDLAFLLEANRRGYAIAGNVLTGRWPSGKKKHKSKKRGN
jgi:hypothetical protein